MKLFNKLYGLSLFTLLLAVSSCTSETEEQLQKPAPEPSGGEARREVLLTLKNKLSVAQTKAGDEIATAAENKISALDIYVFGSTTEDGTYTYQERLCYRESNSDFPVGLDVTAFDLTAKDAGAKETTALLSLKKGLFVKLYCIANQTKLMATDGTLVTNFQSLSQSNPGQKDNTVIPGVPDETTFQAYHSPLIDPASATDILQTPLPMTGAYTTPLDLTDFSVSARLQLGFRLTRSVARFDIVNDAATSKFTIQSIGLAKGRKGVSYFPLKVTGSLPTAARGDLITYPARPFDGGSANAGTTVSAFYSYPSPKEDGGYLILSGTYAANQTENIAVTYKVPFKPEGDGNYIEVSHNHRYTVNITAADEYHLDFTLDVADWTDEGTIDEYEPGGETDGEGLIVGIATGVEYDKTSRTITVALDDISDFKITGSSVGGYFVSKYYIDSDKDHDWLKITGPDGLINTRADNGISEYTISLNEAYHDTDFPLAFLRFTDKISAKESVMMVQAISAPRFERIVSNSTGAAYADNVITFDVKNAVQTFNINLEVFSAIGSKVEKQPDWLTVSPTTIAETSGNYQFTLSSLPDPLPKAAFDDTKFDIVNLSDESKKAEIAVKMTVNNPEIITAQPTVAGVSTGSFSYYDTANKKMYLFGDNSDVKLTVFSLGGCEVTGVPSWMTVTPGDVKNTMTLTFKQNTIPTTENVSATIQIQNKLDNTKKTTITVYNKMLGVRFQDFSGSNKYSYLETALTNTTPSVVYFPTQQNYFTFKVRTPFGISVTDNTSWINYPDVTDNIVQSNGDILSTVKVTMLSSISATNCNTRRKTGAITVTGQNTSQTKKMNIKTEHMTVNIPEGAHNSPPTLLKIDPYNNSTWMWMSQNVGVGNATIYYETWKKKCPSGWTSMNAGTLSQAMSGQSFGANTGEHPYKSATVKNSMQGAGLPYLAIDGPGNFMYASYGDNYVLGYSANDLAFRCVRSYDHTTDQ